MNPIAGFSILLLDILTLLRVGMSQRNLESLTLMIDEKANLVQVCYYYCLPKPVHWLLPLIS